MDGPSDIDLADFNCAVFAEANDFIGFMETDALVAAAPRLEAERPAHAPGGLLLVPPTYYSLANGVGDNRRVNDAMLRLAAAWGARACGVAEPKYADAAREEIARIAALGTAGIAWSPRAQGLFADDGLLIDHCRFAADLGLVSLIHCTPYSVNEALDRVWRLAEGLAGAPLLVLGALSSWEAVQALRGGRGGPANLVYEISGLSEARDLETLVADMGAARLVFGGGGARLAARTLALVEQSALSPDAKAAILRGDAARGLGLRLQG